MMMGNEFVFLVFYQSPPVIGDGNKTINEISNGLFENAISQQRLLIFGEMGELCDDFTPPTAEYPAKRA